MKFNDLSEAEKLDRFLRALVPNVRVQVELRGPASYYEALMYAEHADAILSRVTAQDSGREWLKSNADLGRNFQRSFQTRSIGGPEPMEIGTINRKPLIENEKKQLLQNGGCFFC